MVIFKKTFIHSIKGALKNCRLLFEFVLNCLWSLYFWFAVKSLNRAKSDLASVYYSSSRGRASLTNPRSRMASMSSTMQDKELALRLSNIKDQSQGTTNTCLTCLSSLFTYLFISHFSQLLVFVTGNFIHSKRLA